MSTLRLAILMATYQGEAWLRPQLGSFAAQTHRPDLILSSDDGSTDNTPVILEDFAAENPNLPLRRLDGPRTGSAANFLSLIARTPTEVDRVAFADQDDVWLPGKLARACACLDAVPEDIPSLYCGRVSVCDADLVPFHSTRVPPRGPSFRNALTQNIATGHTIVLNRAALGLARAAVARGGRAVVHDWWLYQLVTGAGGRVLFDAGAPQVLYRQHETNLIGVNSGVRPRLRRLGKLWDGTYGSWNATNLDSLIRARDLLTPENADMVSIFAAARRTGPLGRVRAIGHLGLHRQGRAGQASLYAAALLGKI